MGRFDLRVDDCHGAPGLPDARGDLCMLQPDERLVRCNVVSLPRRKSLDAPRNPARDWQVGALDAAVHLYESFRQSGTCEESIDDNVSGRRKR
jgi:hypothetical protein